MLSLSMYLIHQIDNDGEEVHISQSIRQICDMKDTMTCRFNGEIWGTKEELQRFNPDIDKNIAPGKVRDQIERYHDVRDALC